MSKTYQTFTLGGKERGFRLRNKTIDFIGEITGSDPLEFTPKGTTWKDIRDYAKVILHAGILSDLHSKNEVPDFSSQEVDQWMDDIAPQEIYMVSDMYRQFLNPSIISANGEVGADTRGGQAANVAGG